MKTRSSIPFSTIKPINHLKSLNHKPFNEETNQPLKTTQRNYSICKSFNYSNKPLNLQNTQLHTTQPANHSSNNSFNLKNTLQINHSYWQTNSRICYGISGQILRYICNCNISGSFLRYITVIFLGHFYGI